MQDTNPVLGRVWLTPEAVSIPDEGLSVSTLRVELSEKGKQDSAWIAELHVLGDLPWQKGEERRVKLRVMSDEFKNHIVSTKSDLLVSRGGDIIGILEID